MTVEMVLIITIFIGLAYLVKEKLFGQESDKNAFHQFITTPWKSVLVMMESGVWIIRREQGRQWGQDRHPNHFKRIRSEQGQNPIQ